jgi:dTDP-4-amino-4,6-dideoxygalactose transaminase
MDGLQGAILNVKMKYIEEWTEKRRENAAYYDEILGSVEGVIIPHADSRARHVYHLYVVQVAGNRDAILAALHEKGIGAGIHYPIPCHLQPALASLGYKEGDFPIAESVANQIISLPMFPELTHEQMDYIAATLREVISVKA